MGASAQLVPTFKRKFIRDPTGASDDTGPSIKLENMVPANTMLAQHCT